MTAHQQPVSVLRERERELEQALHSLHDDMNTSLLPSLSRYFDYVHEINNQDTQSWSNYAWLVSSDSVAGNHVTFGAYIFGEWEVVSVPWAFFEDPDAWMAWDRKVREDRVKTAEKIRAEALRSQEVAMLHELAKRYPEEIPT